LSATRLAARDRIIAEAITLEAAGRCEKSLALINRALVDAPTDAELLVTRAATLFAWGRFWEARKGFLRAEAAGQSSALLYRTLGWSWLMTGKPVEAEKCMRKGIAMEPDAWSMYAGLASALQAQKRHGEAAAAYERVLELQPESMDCMMNLVVCKLDEGDPIAAEALSRRAVAIDDGRAMAWANLGVALARQDRYEDAFEPFERALRLEAKPGEECDSFVNIASSLRDAGRTKDALDLYEKSLAKRPNLYGYGDYSVTLLSVGRLLEGWSYYEFRWLQDPLLSARPGFRQPVWAGQDLQGKVILLRVEQGFGDTVQFIRYAPLLKALGATVVLQIRKGLEGLATGFRGVDSIVDRDDAPPAFDFYISLMSLPRVFGTDLMSIPAEVPYLNVDAARAREWANHVGGDGALKVGLVWAGNPDHPRDRYRSMPLQMLAPLLNLSGARFYSLQKGPAGAQAEALSRDLKIVQLGPELKDFADTAALISVLDLLICVDTAPAHIAGAMGKPVWLMLPHPAEYRWMQDRDDSPWYPSMRLFRQSRLGDWAGMVKTLEAALQERLRSPDYAATSNVGDRSTLAPTLWPPSVATIGAPPTLRQGFCAVAEMRVGVLQYLPDEPDVGASLGWYGEYLQPQLDLLARIVPPGATVVEVAAGIGAHSVFLAEMIGTEGHLLLYEPRPVMQRILRQNLSVNRIANVTIMRQALGGPRLAANSMAGVISHSGEPAHAKAATIAPETLDALQLDSLQCLKVNSDADAMDILRGATETLWRLRPLLFIVAPDQKRLADLANRVKEFSYRCWRLETRLFNPRNFNRRETDIFGGRAVPMLLAIPEEIEVDVVLEGCVEIL
jgi:FkbM family methyltransferase